MKALGAVLRWVGRKAVLFTLLFAGIFAYAVWSSGDVQDWWTARQTENARKADALEAVLLAAERQEQAYRGELERAKREALQSGAGQLQRQIADTEAELRRLENDEAGSLRTIFAAATLDIAAVRAEQERRLKVAFLERKLSGLKATAAVVRDGTAGLAITDIGFARAQAAAQRSRKAFADAQRACTAAQNRLAAFDADVIASTLDQLPFVDERESLIDARDARCRTARAAKLASDQADRAASLAQAAGLQRARAEAWGANDLPDVLEDLRTEIVTQRELARNTLSARVQGVWQHYDGDALLRKAAAALILVILSPYLVRLFAWFVLAPLAMRRPHLRLAVPGGMGAAIPPATPSATSVAVRLEAGEELLVRQDYLQTSSVTAKAATVWLIDWTKPITSLATGLFFLTRIRGAGEVTTISATRDGLAEVTILSLPQGASCVLHPRAIAAAVQPVGRPIPITSHWRLLSLNAWLTMQLRYLVFHGPARIVLKGGRGVRVEAAEHGRIFGPDQLVGFSADLAYSVTRTETFWPYFVGRAPLLKDRVIAGEGVLIIEEAPLSARSGQVRRGLEGMIDAGMKAFGL